MHPRTQAEYREQTTRHGGMWSVSKTRYCPGCRRQRSLRQFASPDAKLCNGCNAPRR